MGGQLVLPIHTDIQSLFCIRIKLKLEVAEESVAKAALFRQIGPASITLAHQSGSDHCYSQQYSNDSDKEKRMIQER